MSASSSSSSAGEKASSVSHLSTHPVLLHKLTKLRDKRTPNKVFRELLREITFYLGYEATRDLAGRPCEVQTPVGTCAGQELAQRVALIPVMRAGLGMVEPMLTVLPNACVHHIGMFRNKFSLQPVLYFNKLPAKVDCDVAIILEPMIATAGTLSAVVGIVKDWGMPGHKIKVMSIIGSKEGIRHLKSQHPDVSVTVCAIDDELTEEGYILPGLGDAGDRQYQTASHETDDRSSAARSPVPFARGAVPRLANPLPKITEKAAIEEAKAAEAANGGAKRQRTS